MPSLGATYELVTLLFCAQAGEMAERKWDFLAGPWDEVGVVGVVGDGGNGLWQWKKSPS